MIKSITAPELAAMLTLENPPRLLDVREPEEHEIAALPNSTLLPLGQIPGRVQELSEWKNEAVVIYCHHGVRSLHAIHFLAQAGFTNLTNLSGGIDAGSREVDPKTPRY